jgi:AGZA family xanthine/uracil permease-like MFS transporter
LANVLTTRPARGALLIALLATTGLTFLIHFLAGADVSNAPGVQGSWPISFPPPSFATFGAGILAAAEVVLVLPVLTALLVIFTIKLSDVVDTVGRMYGLAEQGNLLDAEDNVPGTQRVLRADGRCRAVSGALSASSVTMKLESGAGSAEGVRTGLASVVTGCCFSPASSSRRSLRRSSLSGSP